MAAASLIMDKMPPEQRANTLIESADVVSSSRIWDGLPASTGAVGGAAWVEAWLDVFGLEHDTRVVILGEAEKPVAVLPLVVRRRHPWVWELMGVRQLGEQTDVRVADGVDLEPMVDDIVRRRIPLRLSRLPAGSPLLPHLRSLHGRRAVVVSRPVPGTPLIDLDQAWGEPEQHFNARRRADFRAAMRRAQRLGEVSFSIEKPRPDEVGALFDEMVAVEASGWKSRAGSALASRPNIRAFFLRYCSLASAHNAIRFAFLRIDGRPIAVQLAIEENGRYSLLKIGFDEQFARCSPGNLLMMHTVRDVARRGLQSFEFLGAEESWIALWTKQVRPSVSVHVYPISPRSAMAAGEMATELAKRRIRRFQIARAKRQERGTLER